MCVEVVSRVVASRVAAATGRGRPLDEVLADSLFHEQRRLKDERPSRQRDLERAHWDGVRRALPSASETDLRELLERVATRYVEEIVGNFDARIFRFSTRVLPPALGLLLNAVSPRRLLGQLPRLPDLKRNVIFQGELDHLRRLAARGTLIVAPTHQSNMDSILIGWSLHEIGIPPVLYGAGLNLFANPVLGFFMRNLGAYTVDRRKKDELYKEVLKTYATCTLELGYHNLFFPGGTRARSGAVERKLKLGLLGTGIAAYIHNLRQHRPAPAIFIAPCTLSYQLVLEAETLIDDWLQEEGKSRFIISDDEFSRPRRIAQFLSQLLSLDSRIYVTVGRAVDPFGNPVDDDGISRDPVGRPIEIARYVAVDGAPAADPQRDAEYTREVGQKLARAYLCDNVVYATHALARAMWRRLRRQNPGLDLFRLLRSGGRERDVEVRVALQEIAALIEQLRGLAAQRRIRLDGVLGDGDAEAVLRDGLRHFAIYHTTPAVQRRGDRLFAVDRNLMLYYANRLDGYDLDGCDATGLRPRPGGRTEQRDV
ncbi:MAG: 1-acyl-sn-glycerol-3-phosphate acyltransferase [Deltaproteobacteria bacterium]|nr:1-acyl-sn-glycerol-3-phosphate acyltransferase [Deltaproteobacteria bacterium]